MNKVKYYCKNCRVSFLDTPSSKRKFCSYECYWSFKAGRPWPSRRGSGNPLWKGQKAKYFTKHDWVRRNWGKANVCDTCGSKDFVEWANISGKYLRIRKDWQKLCRRCHMLSDGRLNQDEKGRFYATA